MPRGLAPQRNKGQITKNGLQRRQRPPIVALKKMPPSEIGLTVEPVRIHSQPTP